MSESVKREKLIKNLEADLLPFGEKLGEKLLQEVYNAFQGSLIGIVAGASKKSLETEVTPEELEAEKLASQNLAGLEEKYKKLISKNHMFYVRKTLAEVEAKPDQEELIGYTNATLEEEAKAKLLEEKAQEAINFLATVSSVRNKRGMAGVEYLLEKLGLQKKAEGEEGEEGEKINTAKINAGDWLVLDLCKGDKFSYTANFRYFSSAKKLDIMPMKASFAKTYGVEPGKWYTFCEGLAIENCTLLQNGAHDTIENVLPVHTSLKKAGEAVAKRYANGNMAGIKAGGTSNCYLISEDPKASRHVIGVAEAKEKYFTVVEAKPEEKAEAK